MLKVLIFSTVFVFEECFSDIYSYTSNQSLDILNDLITNDIAINNSTLNSTFCEDILSIVDFLREKKEFVKLSIFIHHTGIDLKNQNSAVTLWHLLWKLSVSALVSIIQQPAIEREIHGEQLIFYSTDELAVENAVTMMTRVRPLYFISANIECNNDLTEIATSIPADIEVYVVSLCDGTIYEAYHFDPDLPVVRAIARKDNENGVWFLIAGQSMRMRRRNMDGLKLIGKGFRPLIFDRNDPLYKKMVLTDRYVVDIWDDLTRLLNFTLLIVEGVFSNTSQINSTPWDEMIEMLISHEIDVPTNLVTVTEQVAHGYTMKATVLTASYQLMFHSPFDHDHQLMSNVLNPFDKNLWIALACMLFVVLPLALCVLLRKETEFGNAALLPLRCITSQGLGFSPEGTSARVGCLVTLLFCFMIIMYYESILITFLKPGHSHHPFSSLEQFYAKGYGFDLIYQKEVNWSLMGDWNIPEDPTSKLALGIPPPKGNRVLALGSRREAAKRLCSNPRNTTIFDLPYHQTHHFKCPYFVDKHKYMSMHLGIAARHNLSAYPFITTMIKSMHEYGITDRIKKSFHVSRQKIDFNPLSLNELETIFLLYHYAVLFSIVILILELLWFSANKILTIKFRLKNEIKRRSYHNKRIKDLQMVLEQHDTFKHSDI